MNAPVHRKIQDRQNHTARCLGKILDFVIESAQMAGVLPEDIDKSYTTEFPEIATQDLQKGAQTLSGVATAMQLGAQEGWVTGETAARAFHTVLAEIGVDIPDSKEEYENAQQEKEDRAAQQQDLLAPQSALNAALKKLQQGGKGNAAGTGVDDEQTVAANALVN
jgi:hypothetical protein